jgi:hypothetical protein
MAGWEKIPYGWEDTHGKYRFISQHQETKDLPETEFDVIVVMAGGLDEKGYIHPWGGTYHKPPALNDEKFVIHEATACAEYLINNGVSPHDIIKEWASYDTIASIYFTLLLCITPRNWRNICVITSTFHMARVEILFRWIYGLHQHYHCTFLKASDDNLDQNIVRIRTGREKSSLVNVWKLMDKITTKEAFHQWLFTEHKAYACNYLNGKKEKIPDAQKKSY